MTFKVEEEMKSHTIETTIGDLICAISEAAQESGGEEQYLNELTHMVLMEVLSKNK